MPVNLAHNFTPQSNQSPLFMRDQDIYFDMAACHINLSSAHWKAHMGVTWFRQGWPRSLMHAEEITYSLITVIIN
jgi:hypothetical protein